MTIVLKDHARNQSDGTERPPTLAELAAAKCLPIATLKTLGWYDSPQGVVIPYHTREGALFRTRIRPQSRS